jgi:hypothetical protein
MMTPAVWEESILACPLRPTREPMAPRTCKWCATSLPKGRRSWCGDSCYDAAVGQHSFGQARLVILRRAEVSAIERMPEEWVRRPHDPGPIPEEWRHRRVGYACEQCGGGVGRVEVDHIERAMGRHGQWDCIHHHANLRALCEPCHRARTAEQRVTPESLERRRQLAAQQARREAEATERERLQPGLPIEVLR